MKSRLGVSGHSKHTYALLVTEGPIPNTNILFWFFMPPQNVNDLERIGLICIGFNAVVGLHIFSFHFLLFYNDKEISKLYTA